LDRRARTLAQIRAREKSESAHRLEPASKGAQVIDYTSPR
jgi:hypothetical protein